MSEVGWIEPADRVRVSAVAESLHRTSPLERVRALVDAGGLLDRRQIEVAARDGILLPLLADGSATAACTVLDQWGRSLAPAPVVELNVIADALQRSGHSLQGLLADISQGAVLVTWASSNLPGYWGSGAGVVATTSGSDVILNGVAAAVPHAAEVDLVLVAASDGGGVSQLFVPPSSPGVELFQLDALDLTRTRYEMRLSEVVLPASAVLGERGVADLTHQTQLGVVLSVAQTIGAMAALFEFTLGYAKSRVAFSRPIGSFQAVKHMLVDAGLALEMSHAMREAATVAFDSGSGDSAEMISMAKAFVSRAGIELAHTCWQVLGGVAYQWDHDFHLFLRRITADAALFGTGAWHDEHVLRLHATEVGS
jgi:alkylation response protein AidB-like acyl-CoA dehydrogenase